MTCPLLFFSFSPSSAIAAFVDQGQMESSEADSRSPETNLLSSRDAFNSDETDQAESSSRSSDVSSQSGQQSPSLSPMQSHPMTNSIISNLDLGEDDGGVATSFSASQDQRDAIKSGYSNGRITPLAPRDVLGQSASLSSIVLSDFLSETRLPEHTNEGSNLGGALGADDSALDALVAAHERQDSLPYSPQAINNFGNIAQAETPTRKGEQDTIPDTRDASFGLDPDADTSHTVEGSPFRAAHTAGSKHHRHNSRERSIYEMEEANAPSHATAATGAPETMKTNLQHTQTVPTASSTGMPRFWPRRTSRSPSNASSSHSSQQPSPPKEIMPNYPPSGSLTLAIFANGITWRRRSYLLLASVAINLGLPFINGVMLGFGEIFARTIVAPWIGLAPASININAPGPRSAAAASTSSGVGLRYAGLGESRGTAGGNVSVESWEVEPGQRGRRREPEEM